MHSGPRPPGGFSDGLEGRDIVYSDIRAAAGGST
jgi:hypothetical protein